MIYQDIEQNKFKILHIFIFLFLSTSIGKSKVNWTAYNDCHTNPVGDTQTNVTAYTIYSGNTGNNSGTLQNFQNGEFTGMPEVTITMIGTLGTSTSGGAAANPDPNTDAYNIFYDDDNVILDFSGNIVDSQDTAGWAQVIEFSYLDPNMTYTFVATAIRANHYPARKTLVVIEGHNGAKNNSSKELVKPDENSAIFQPGNNTSTGYVVRWDEIVPGYDSSNQSYGFTIRSEDDGSDSDYKSYPINGFMLQEHDYSGNHPPLVDAGNNQEITLPDHIVFLDGFIRDDGIGDPNGFLANEWSVLSGPGIVTFDPNEFIKDPTVILEPNIPGIYEIQLMATDGELQAFDSITITVYEPDHSPYPPILIKPLDEEPNVSHHPDLEIIVSDPDNDELDIVFWGRKVQSDEDPFTIIALADTQYYSQSYPEIFTAQTQWILDEINEGTRNIVFVSHLGDIAQNPQSEMEWDNVRNSMGILDSALLDLDAIPLPDPFVPYGIMPGNKDMPTVLYNQCFPFSRYKDVVPWYGGHYPNDPCYPKDPNLNKYDNNYQLFSAGGSDFIILHIEHCPAAQTLLWANQVLDNYANRKAIISIHGFINEYGDRNVSFCGNTQYIWDDLIQPNDNVYLVLCGHNGSVGEALRTDIVGERSVHQLLSCYQRRANGGDGWLRIMRFVPTENMIYVQTYSPWLDQYETDYNSEFSIDFPLGESFYIIGSINNVPSGSSINLEWNDLVKLADYQWYVSISDPCGNTTISPAWNFQTGPSLEPSNPVPNLNQTYVDVNITLSWTAGEDTSYHDVYFDTLNPPETLLAGNISTTFCDPTLLPDSWLDSCTTYYWQVIGKNESARMPGHIWSFKTQLIGDVNSDKQNDLLDLYTYISYWLTIDCSGPDFCQGTDLNRDTKVNAIDYSILMQNWNQRCNE